MKFSDEIEDLSGLGQCVCVLLTTRTYGVKASLWEMFERILRHDVFEDLKEVVNHWEEEQQEGKEIEIEIERKYRDKIDFFDFGKEPKSKKDDWL